MKPSLTCRGMVEWTTELREGTLAAPLRALRRVHLFCCARCRAFEGQMDATIAELGALPSPGAPPPSVERALAAFRKRSAP